MAGLIPEKRSKNEIERANRELLQKNQTYMGRWIDWSKRDSSSEEETIGCVSQSRAAIEFK